jgi:hypothetical protein
MPDPREPKRQGVYFYSERNHEGIELFYPVSKIPLTTETLPFPAKSYENNSNRALLGSTIKDGKVVEHQLDSSGDLDPPVLIFG